MDMTAREAKEAFTAFVKEIGGRAWLNIGLSTWGGQALHCRIYPEGATNSCAVEGFGDDWDELLANTRALWATSSERHRAERVRKMALAIISITAEQGVCTDAALRAGEFSAEEVSRYGAEAVEDANAIAQNGPFSIAKLAGANAA